MKREIIITDLTRFRPGKPEVCTAGIDASTGECIRPRPYLPFSEFTRLGIFPGGVLYGDFTPFETVSPPHVEDCSYKDLKFRGPCSSNDFKAALERSSFPSIEEGFTTNLPVGEKVIPITTPPSRSIITLKIDPSTVEIAEDGFKPDRIRIHFRDGSGRSYRYFSIADLGFHDYAQRHRESGALDTLNAQISDQECVYLRIGLGRLHKNEKGKEGFWLQANGIYTFPQKLSYIRSYPPEDRPSA